MNHPLKKTCRSRRDLSAKQETDLVADKIQKVDGAVTMGDGQSQKMT
jgi:hypothetical protein